MHCSWGGKAGWLIQFVDNVRVAGKTVSSLVNTCHAERFIGEFSRKVAIQMSCLQLLKSEVSRSCEAEFSQTAIHLLYFFLLQLSFITCQLPEENIWKWVVQAFFYGPDVPLATKPTASKHCRKQSTDRNQSPSLIHWKWPCSICISSVKPIVGTENGIQTITKNAP